MFIGKVVSSVTGLITDEGEVATLTIRILKTGESFRTDIINLMNKTVYIGEDRRADRAEGPGFERLNGSKVSSEAMRICREINLDVGINGVVKIDRNSRLAERIKKVSEGTV